MLGTWPLNELASLQNMSEVLSLILQKRGIVQIIQTVLWHPGLFSALMHC